MKLPKNPTPEQVKQVMNLVIKSIYTRGTVAVQTIERDSRGRLSGIFLGDGVRFNYTVADGALSYAPVNPGDLPNEDGADFMEDALDFARLKIAGNTKQVKACKKGYACGYTCISQNRNCRKPLPGQAKTAAEWVAQQKGLDKPTLHKGTPIQAKASRESLQEEVDLRRLRDRLKELEARKKDRQAKGLYGKEAGKQGDDWALGMEIPALRKQISDQKVKVAEAKQRRAEESAAAKAQQESRVDQPQKLRNDDNNINERYKNRPKADRNISGLALATIDYVARNAGYNITSSRKGYKVTKDGQEFTFPRLIDVDKFISSRR